LYKKLDKYVYSGSCYPVKYKSKKKDSRTAITMMTDRFAFLEYNKCKRRAATAVTRLSVLLLLLLPASLGYGGTIIQEASGQFALPQLEEPTPPEEDTTPPPTTPTTPTTPPATTNYTNNIRDPSIFLLRGLIGSYLPTQGAAAGGGAITPAADDSGHVVTGRFRVFANESLVRRFVAEMSVAAVDGSSFHNLTITESAPHRFQVTEGSNGTTATTSVPVVSSNILGTIYLDGGATPVIDNVPMTLTIRGQSLAIQGIDIDEARIADTGQRDAISVIDGQSIYGIVP
jgi:hypothetical protein